MALIYANDIVILPFVSKVCENIDWSSRNLLARVRANGELVVISFVSRKLNSEYSLASDCVFVAATEKLGSLASEHAAHDELYATTLHLLGILDASLSDRLA